MELVLNTFGTSLQVEDGLFLVKHKDGKQSIDPKTVKSILVSKGAKISSDAALLAIANEIDVLFLDPTGKPGGRLWSIKYGSISEIRRAQLEFLYSPKAVKWVKQLIKNKIDNQIGLLLTLDSENDEQANDREKSLNRLRDYLTKVETIDAPFVSDIAPTLRGWEGAASKAYFETINKFLPTEYQFAERTQHPAYDIFNCLLNYAYGILYGKVEGALIKAGIDPYAGIFHRDDYNRPALVFDVIELYRIWADYVVISLCCQKVIDADCYSIKDDGSYWLENMGRRIVIQSMNDYMDEVINIKGLSRSRHNHIELYAHNLAQTFLKG